MVVVLISFVSCSWKHYSEDKYLFGKGYQVLIKSNKVGDTLVFSNYDQRQSFKIAKIDSILHDERGHFINQREYKEVSIHLQEIPNGTIYSFNKEQFNISITKYPDQDSTYFDLSFQGFHGSIASVDFNISNDTLNVDNLQITNFYKFLPWSINSKDSNSVTEVYITPEKGIVAYKDSRKRWWKRLK